VSESSKDKTAWRYRLDRQIRTALIFILVRIVPRCASWPADLRREKIEKIILVRGVFRLGNATLATPAILLFRPNFPTAQIDFVGANAAKPLLGKVSVYSPVAQLLGVSQGVAGDKALRNSRHRMFRIEQEAPNGSSLNRSRCRT
jgi:hypothetical protein